MQVKVAGSSGVLGSLGVGYSLPLSGFTEEPPLVGQETKERAKTALKSKTKIFFIITPRFFYMF